MKMKKALSHSMGERNTEADLMESVIGNRAKFVFQAHLATDSSSVGSIYNPKKWIHFYAKDASDGNRHTWFKGAQVLIAAYGTNGGHVATIGCSPVTLTFVDGAATATLAFVGSTAVTVIKDGEWNVKIKKFHCLGENIATSFPWKFRFKT